MKTSTENSTLQNKTESQNLSTVLPTSTVAKPTRSLRPSKSMVKVRSLRPQRIEIGTKLRRKPIKA